MEPLLRVSDLDIEFKGDHGIRQVTDKVSFTIAEGESVGLVGESGCGKSSVAQAILRVLPSNGRIKAGHISFEGKDLNILKEKELDRIRGRQIGMVFQDALSGLNPVLTIGTQILEPMKVHLKLEERQRRERAISLLKETGLDNAEEVMKKYPGELSGGQRQRALLAIALCCDPKLLIADEPTSALDVTVQARIMEMTAGMIRRRKMAMLLITHDIAYVANNTDRILVMYAGQILEEGKADDVLSAPAHPYTDALFKSIPSVLSPPGTLPEPVKGAVPEDYSAIPGCRFFERCERGGEECRSAGRAVTVADGHHVRCIKAG